MASIFYFFGEKNVFILGNQTQTGGFAEGGVYVGGTAHYTSYNVGTTLPVVYPPNPLPRSYSLYVLGNMNITGGSNTQNSALSPSGTLTTYSMTSVGGLAGQPLIVDEWHYPNENLIDWLECTSYSLAELAVNGVAALTGTVLTFTGTDPSQNYFTIDGDSILGSGTPIGNITQVNLNVPAGATALINVIGTNLALNNITTLLNGATPTAAQSQNILWNMPIAAALAFNSTIYGSILAPSASTTAAAASQQYGTIYTENLYGSLVSRSAIFTGKLPEFSDPSFTSSCTYTT
ncbi:MAG: choice-of-anchor A family protein, partial [Clostridia bacterium]